MGIISPEKQSAGFKVFLALILPLLAPILLVGLLIYLLWGVVLYTVIWLTRRKPFVVFVYSNSPNWKDYVEQEILPHLPGHAAILNWSERRTWKISLAVLTFRYFSEYRNFNPMAIVIQPFHFVKTYRFFEAFKAFKHGDPRKVVEIKDEFFKVLNIQKLS
jgi:hypothetical protein